MKRGGGIIKAGSPQGGGEAAIFRRKKLRKEAEKQMILAALKANKNNRSALGTAASDGHADIVKRLIQSNANLNIKGKWGTPLKEAIDDKKPEVVKLLRAAGAKK